MINNYFVLFNTWFDLNFVFLKGKAVDKDLLNSLKVNNNYTMGPPRLRNKIQSGRPRPKTIHIDRSDTPDGTLSTSKGNKGSITNFTSEYNIC